jgi:hypothetical protein
MAFRSFKKDVEKFYQRIDKIAKKGRDNFQEYYDFVDDCIFKQQYGILTQVLYLKYDFDYTRWSSVEDVKSRSWTQICFKTTSFLQDSKYRSLRENNLYQIGLDIFRENPLTSIKLIDPVVPSGSGAEFTYVLSSDENRGIIQIGVKNQGSNYSTFSYLQISGGDPSATANPFIRNGYVLKVDILSSGSNHDVNVKLGRIQEVDEYVTPIDNISYTENRFQQDTDNKKTYLLVDKTGVTSSVTFSSWNFGISYDKNLLNLYSEAINYLI